MEAGEFLGAVASSLATGAVAWFAGRGVERSRSRRPLTVHVDRDLALIYGPVPDWVSFPYYFDCEREQLPRDPPAKGTDWWSWAVSRNGVEAVHSEIMLTIVSRAEASVVVDGFRAEIVEISPAPSGAIVVHPVGGADIVHRQASVELGSMGTTTRFIEQGSAAETSGFTFALGKGEPARLSVTVSTFEPGYLYRWIGVIDMIAGGRRRSVKVSDQGRPFVLHGGANCSQFEWSEGAWRPHALA